MQKSEPKLIADGYTDEEIFQWMRSKTMTANLLKSALAEKLVLEQALDDVNSRIKDLTNEAAVVVVQESEGPIPHP